MTAVVPHPAVTRWAEATVAAIFTLPVSQGVRVFIRAYLFATPVTREALIEAVVTRLARELSEIRAAAKVAA